MATMDAGVLTLRVVAGLVFAAHGAQKAFGWWSGPGFAGWRAAMARMGLRPPLFWATVSMGVELAGGLLLVVGLLTPLATAALVGQAIVMIWQVHLPKGFWNSRGGIEFPLTLGAIAVALAAIGPGAFSLDRAFGLVYPGDVQAAALVVGVAGAIVALLLPRLVVPMSAAAEPR